LAPRPKLCELRRNLTPCTGDFAYRAVMLWKANFRDLDDMHYPDSGPRSAEILRLALPSISKHGGSFVPTAYAVWYEHLSGINPRLTDDLNRRLEQSGELDQEEFSDLYAEHILTRQVGNARILQKSLETLAQQLEQHAVNSSGTAEKFAHSLDASQSELATVTDPTALQALLQKLIASTQDARTSVGSLRAELAAQQSELRSVRARLGNLETEVARDPLTGLLNRRGFDQAVQQLRAGGLNLTACSVLMIDLDHFKRVNDSYGHLFGDQVLCAAAKMLTGVIKGRDVAARFGGEEFVVLLPETPERGALALAEQFREAFSRAKVRRTGSDKVVDKVTVSMGVACPDPGESLEATLDRADAALYRAKNEGRNCVRLALPG
jgi:diguanylate cyclase